MYERERVIIDIRTYNIDDFFCRYKEGRIVFYERHRITKSQWEKQIPDIMWALKRGIPFPPIYASELQTGEFLIFDKNSQDTHSGGSGCACCGTVFSGYLFKQLREKKIKKLLLIATGALMNSTSSQQGESIPGIAHAISIEI